MWMNGSYTKSDITINTCSYCVMVSSVICQAGGEGVHFKGKCKSWTPLYDCFMCFVEWYNNVGYAGRKHYAIVAILWGIHVSH